MTYFNQKRETMARARLAQYQLEHMQAMLARMKRNVRRYRELLGDVHIEDLSEIAQLPLTSADFLIDSIPYGLFSLPLREVIRLQWAFGPAGKQLVIGHTRNDLLQWGQLAARSFAVGGITASDVIQIMYGVGIESASGYLLGAEQIEASVIPTDSTHIEYQLGMMINYRATALVTTPTNALDLLALIEEKKIDPQSLNLRAVFLNRPVADDVREQIRSGLFAPIFCNIGIPEIIDPGLCVQCEYGHYHVNEDHFLVETVDDELIISTLTREAMPLLRYQTRVNAELSTTKCKCGRTGQTLLLGTRRDDQMLVNEIPIYKEQVEAVLADTRLQGQDFYLENEGSRLRICVTMSQEIFDDTVRFIEDINWNLRSRFLNQLGIDTTIQFVSARK